MFAFLIPTLNRWHLLFFVLALHVCLAQASGEARLVLGKLPSGPLGEYVQVLSETTESLSLDTAISTFDRNLGQPGQSPVLNFGIGARPHWLRLRLINTSDSPMPLQIILSASWLDRIDVHLTQDQKLLSTWSIGDRMANPPALSPPRGYSVEALFPPGGSELYIRAETDDPMVIQLALISANDPAEKSRALTYAYGALYGYLLALCAYNLLLFFGLRERSHLYYSLYLLSYILMNIAYTGHGMAWFWGDAPAIQRYIILVMMVLFSDAGLLFALRFLDLAALEPNLARWVRRFMVVGPIVMGLCIVLDQQAAAALFAFSYTTAFTVIMLILGLVTREHRHSRARYFLLAASTGTLSSATTALAVWGFLPFSLITFHAMEAGLMCEATLFALALTYRVRRHQQARARAEDLAQNDPLTGLLNRRGFLEVARLSWSYAERMQRPISIIMLDIDHFKQVNDVYGHRVGDLALKQVAHTLTDCCRYGDLLSRWGGEEFVMLLPETRRSEANLLADRIRQVIASQSIHLGKSTLAITMSLGVAERTDNIDIDELIKRADDQLIKAKSLGRNRVCV